MNGFHESINKNESDNRILLHNKWTTYFTFDCLRPRKNRQVIGLFLPQLLVPFPFVLFTNYTAIGAFAHFVPACEWFTFYALHTDVTRGKK